jgi:hypothetical protein
MLASRIQPDGGSNDSPIAEEPLRMPDLGFEGLGQTLIRIVRPLSKTWRSKKSQPKPNDSQRFDDHAKEPAPRHGVTPEFATIWNSCPENARCELRLPICFGLVNTCPLWRSGMKFYCMDRPHYGLIHSSLWPRAFSQALKSTDGGK